MSNTYESIEKRRLSLKNHQRLKSIGTLSHRKDIGSIANLIILLISLVIDELSMALTHIAAKLAALILFIIDGACTYSIDFPR
jgi:hypothetical protein